MTNPPIAEVPQSPENELADYVVDRENFWRVLEGEIDESADEDDQPVFKDLPPTGPTSVNLVEEMIQDLANGILLCRWQAARLRLLETDQSTYGTIAGLKLQLVKLEATFQQAALDLIVHKRKLDKLGLSV